VSIEGDLEINRNYNLLNFNGLGELLTIGGDFLLVNNDDIISLAGLNALISIGGDLEISSNTDLTSLLELENLSSIGGGLRICYNGALSSCNIPGLCDYMTNPHGEVNIYRNGQGCNSIIDIAGACGSTMSCLPYGNYYFQSQSDIDHFQDYFPGCTDLEGIVNITGNDITNLKGLSEVNSINGDLVIRQNYHLPSLTGLNNLTSLNGILRILQNIELEYLDGLESLSFLGGTLSISKNPQLVNLSSLENIDSIGGDLLIDHNFRLDDISGLSNLEYIKGSLQISRNHHLVSLEGLQGLDSIGGDLNIGSSELGNYTLTSLTGLEGLTSIGGDINIRKNTNLTSLAGIDNIDPQSIQGIEITDNPALSECAIHSICEYLKNPYAIVEIADNGTGCDSVQEVELACETVGVDQLAVGSRQLAVKVWPNPTSGSSQFAVRSSRSEHITIKIYDLHGREVATVVDRVMPEGEHVVRFDASSLPPGVYIWQQLAVGSRQLAVGKLIKF
jgi:hypothetical protein